MSEAKRQATATNAHQDIGPPDWSGINYDRRRRASQSLKYHLKEYHPETFNLPWAGYHLKLISLGEKVTWDGGWFAFAVPRSGGKSKISEGIVEWATLHGHKLWPVLIGANQDAALERLTNVKIQLQNNERLLQDFPEVCHPLSCLGRSARKAEGQHINGVPTAIGWGQDRIVFPTVETPIGWEFEDVNGSRINAVGITGSFRGMSATTQSLKTIRPDLVVPDDPQTRESAHSYAQCQKIIAIITGDIAYLGGPKTKMSILVPNTVIAADDAADQILNPELHPEFHGERHKMLVEPPTNIKLWDEYAELRREIQHSKSRSMMECTEFYEANREAMDEDAEVSWPERFNDDEASAIQHAMNRKIDDEAAFQAECQNEPVSDASSECVVCSPQEIILKQHHMERSGVPLYCEKLVSFIDVQQNFLFWGVAGGSIEFECAILDYNLFPDPNRYYFSKSDDLPGLKQMFPQLQNDQQRIYAGLMALIDVIAETVFTREDGFEMRVSRINVDRGFQKETVDQVCRESKHANLLLPCKGKAVSAKDQTPFFEKPKKKGERVGHHWRILPIPENTRQRYGLVDPNEWKSQLHKSIRSGAGAAGSLSLFKQRPERHRLIAEHWNAEKPTRVKTEVREVDEWQEKPTRPDNDFFDVGYNLLAALSMEGCAMPGIHHKEQVRKRKPPLTRAELDRRRGR